MTRGKFFVIDGADGSGTTTLARKLRLLIARHYESHGAVKLTWEPSTGDVGTLIRQRLADRNEPADWREMSYLFMADRIQHVREEIEPALAAGVHVVCDRYYPSTLVYQSACVSNERHDRRRDERMQYLYDEMFGCHLGILDRGSWLDYDKCIYLGVDSVDVLRQRRSSRGSQEMYEDDNTQQGVINAYEHWFQTYRCDGSCVRINASLDLEHVCTQAWGIVHKVLGIPEERAWEIFRNDLKVSSVS